MAKNEPVFKVRVGNISASVFLNEIEKDGKKYTLPSANLQKPYVKQGGDPNNKDDWVNPTIYFRNASEIDKAIVVLSRLKEALYDKEYDGEKK